MNRTLPPFSAIRGFEAAARHESFKLAATELNLSESAISHQIKTLENHLSTQLFERTAQGVRLTSAGQAYRRDLTPLLDALAESTERVRGVPEDGLLTLQSTAAFAARWLAPRLSSLAEAHPEIELKLETGIALPDFERDGIDAAIAYGFEPQPGIKLTPVLSATRFPVCAPEFLDRTGADSTALTPEDLLNFPLLKDEVGDGWENWFRAAGVEGGARAGAKAKGPQMPHCELTLSAAEQGQGVTLAYDVLVERPLAEGRLVRLFEAETQPKVLYSLAYPERWANRPLITALQGWLLAEARAQAEALGSALPAKA